MYEISFFFSGFHLLATIPLWFAVETPPRGLYHSLVVGAALMEFLILKKFPTLYSPIPMHFFAALHLLVGINAFTAAGNQTPARAKRSEFSGIQNAVKYFWCAANLISAIFFFVDPQGTASFYVAQEGYVCAPHAAATLWVFGIVLLYSVALIYHSEGKKNLMLFLAMSALGQALNLFHLNPNIFMGPAYALPVLLMVSALIMTQ